MDGFRPRHQHPSPSHPAVAKISPMVPEVSLFFGGGHHPSAPRSNFNPNNQQQMTNRYYGSYSHERNSYNHSIGSPLPPPQPANRLLQDTARHSSEFSRNFDNLSISESFHSNGNIKTNNYESSNESNNNREKVKFVDFVEPFTSTSPFSQQRSTKLDENVYDGNFRRGRLRESQNNDDSPVPPDILKVLNWQNDQLKLLQEQVSALLQASPQQQQQSNRSTQEYPLIQDGGAISNYEGHSLSEDNRRRISSEKALNSKIVESTASNTDQLFSSVSASSNQRTVATNTSTLWPQIQSGLQKLTEAMNEVEGEEDSYSNVGEIRKSAIGVNNSDNESAQSALNIDLPDYPASDCSPDLKHKRGGAINSFHSPNKGDNSNSWQSPGHAAGGNSWDSPAQAGTSCATSWESPVLGESVSMYEAEQIQEVYTDILSKVNKLLGEPTEPYREPLENNKNVKGSDASQQEVQNEENSVAVATFNRLRQLGVSFISPEDFSSSSRPTANPLPVQNEVSALFLPRAAKPSESVWQQSPDTSLEISSLALKYLDEEQLSKLAVSHSSKAKSGSRDVNMSMATQEFLNRYGLAATSNEAVNSPNLKTGRRPLTPIQNNQGNVQPGATPLSTVGNKQIFGLRREVLKGRYASKESGGANYVGENYCVQNYEMRYNGEDQQQHARLDTNLQHQHKLDQADRQQPEVKNRVLDITAIKSQPKFL